MIAVLCCLILDSPNKAGRGLRKKRNHKVSSPVNRILFWLVMFILWWQQLLCYVVENIHTPLIITRESTSPVRTRCYLTDRWWNPRLQDYPSLLYFTIWVQNQTIWHHDNFIIHSIIKIYFAWVACTSLFKIILKIRSLKKITKLSIKLNSHKI